MNKNILFLLHFSPPVHGSSIVGMQIKESKVINECYDCRYVNLGTSKTIDEIGKNALGKIFRYISILWQVVGNLINHRPDLCYLAITAQGSAFYKDAVVVLLVKLFRVKLIYHFHNKGVSKRQDRSLDNLLYRFVFRNTNVILLSPCLYPDIQKYVSSNAVYYCPNGIESNENVSVQKRVNDCPEILFLSNMLVTKGVFVLIDACKILKQKNIDFYCTFIGGIGDISEILFQSKVKELELDCCIKYIGEKYGQEKEEALVKAAIFIHPTLNDCFPLVLLEAMQFSLPIISTLEGGIPDIVLDGKTGFLVKQSDSNALAEKLELLIQNKDLREEMGKNGRMRYKQNFTLQHFEHNFNTILTNCLLKTP